jgi:hypothetical protein
VAGAVTHHHAAAEAGALACGRLALDRHDLHHLILASLAKKLVNDLVLLDRHGEEEDFLDRLDLAILDEAAKLGARDPLALVASTAVAAFALAFALAL